MKNMIIDDRLLFFGILFISFSVTFSALKCQCSATVIQQRCLQLYLLEPRHASYEFPRYLISDNDNYLRFTW